MRRCWEWAAEVPWAGQSGAPAADAPSPTLLSERQALLLWERIVAASPAAERLLHSAGAVRDAREAWRLLKPGGIFCHNDMLRPSSRIVEAPSAAGTRRNCRARMPSSISPLSPFLHSARHFASNSLNRSVRAPQQT